MKLDSSYDNSDHRATNQDIKQKNISESSNITLKRKRLVRQEAINNYDDFREPTVTETANDDYEELPSTKNFSLQSSTGSTETVIEAPTSPASSYVSKTTRIPSTKKHKRPDNLHISTVQRKYSNGYIPHNVDTGVNNRKLSVPSDFGAHSHVRKKSITDVIQSGGRISNNGDLSVPISGGRRKTSHEISYVSSAKYNNSGRAVSLTSRWVLRIGSYS